jgi:hypothetical protein
MALSMDEQRMLAEIERRLAVIGITVYAMTPFRAYGQRTKPTATTSSVSAPSSSATLHKSSVNSHPAG